MFNCIQFVVFLSNVCLNYHANDKLDKFIFISLYNLTTLTGRPMPQKLKVFLIKSFVLYSTALEVMNQIHHKQNATLVRQENSHIMEHLAKLVLQEATVLVE